MARRRSRLLEARAARRRKPDGPDPAAAIRLAGFGAALLVFIAVGAGFRGERFTSEAARLLGRFAPLVDPVLFGLSVLELGALALVGVLFFLAFRRGVRR